MGQGSHFRWLPIRREAQAERRPGAKSVWRIQHAGYRKSSELLKVRFAGDLIVLKIISDKCAAVISEISNLPLNDNIYKVWS